MTASVAVEKRLKCHHSICRSDQSDYGCQFAAIYMLICDGKTVLSNYVYFSGSSPNNQWCPYDMQCVFSIFHYIADVL